MILSLGLFSLTFTLRASDGVDSLMKRGNDYYLQHQYALAQSCYARILDLGYESGDLYYNLGNSFYKQSKFARAILNYERALQLNPADVDIKDNLSLANLHIIDRIEAIPEFFLKRWIKSLRGLFSPDQWAVAALVFFVLALMSIALFYLSRNGTLKRAGFIAGLVMVSISILFLVFMFSRVSNIRSHNSAIIMAPSVNARSSPDEQSTNVFVLHEGTRVMVTDSVKNWKEIRIANGNTAWIQAEALEEI